MKTPYMIAWGTLADHAIQPHFRRSGNQIAKLIEEAIKTDRRERDSQVIAKKVWVTEDFREAWEDLYADEYPNATPEQVERITQSAPSYLDRSALEDCTNSEWGAIFDAVKESAEAELGAAS